jgi:hypothetical protein
LYISGRDIYNVHCTYQAPFILRRVVNDTSLAL